MDDKHSARPISGEIMTEDAPIPASRERPSSRDDVVDAEFETVSELPRSTAGRRETPESGVSASGLGLLRKEQEQAPSAGSSDRGGPAFWGLGLAIVLLAFWVSGGHTLIRNAPFLQPAQPAATLRIASVKSRIETHEGKALLFVDGEAINDAATTATVPTLSINVLDTQGRTTHYFLGTNDRLLGAGEHFDFSSRLVAPKGGVQSVSVTFKEQRS